MLFVLYDYEDMIILYDYDSNVILAEPIKSQQDTSILEGYKVLTKWLEKAGLTPRLQRLDNECSKILKEYMYDKEIDFQLNSPASQGSVS